MAVSLGYGQGVKKGLCVSFCLFLGGVREDGSTGQNFHRPKITAALSAVACTTRQKVSSPRAGHGIAQAWLTSLPTVNGATATPPARTMPDWALGPFVQPGASCALWRYVWRRYRMTAAPGAATLTFPNIFGEFCAVLKKAQQPAKPDADPHQHQAGELPVFVPPLKGAGRDRRSWGLYGRRCRGRSQNIPGAHVQCARS